VGGDEAGGPKGSNRWFVGTAVVSRSSGDGEPGGVESVGSDGRSVEREVKG
jgi:hypothetical protein